MKYLIATDIHGSIDSTNILIEKFNKFNCDKILLLGDILYHGPRNDLPLSYAPKQVINVLNNYADKIIAVKGNCDAEVDQMVLNFTIHDEYRVNYHLLTHGHHLDTLNLNDIKVVLFGHTHVNKIYKENNITYINVASITIPKENCQRTYGILENNEITLFDINDNEIASYKGE